MNDENVFLASLVSVQAKRIATGDPNQLSMDETCDVATEAPITIDVHGVDSYTMLCTPYDNLAMAAGFLFCEGIIESIDDVELLRECVDNPGVIRVKLKDIKKLERNRGRNLLIVSSCGICGFENMDYKLNSMPKLEDTMRVSQAIILRAMEDLRAKQVLFGKSGGTHAMGIFDSRGEIVAFAEDIGRHNALDKAVGKCVINGISMSGLGAAMSGRISFEMVSKCAQAGIEVICAVSAPTSLAITAANKCGITLLAFVRDTRATIFTQPKRIVGV